MQKHTGAVKGLEFNSFSPNLLASGAADSDLCIWDLSKPSAPSLYPALKGGSSSSGGSSEITYIAWNRKVQHILASSSTNGTTVVWDLKRQKPVISFRDSSSQRRASVLQWNPEIATQLIVASDDDRSPTLQMWDLRNSVSPLKEFVGHTKGVLGLAWSNHDSSLLLSCAKDMRTICWDVQSTEIVCELTNSQNWSFDAQWSPITPGVFSTSSYDGHVAIWNLSSCTGSKMTETVNEDFSVTQQSTGESVPLKKAPLWMRRPACATFGFGGKLVSVTNHKAQVNDATGQQRVVEGATINISQVVTEHELVARSEAFEAAIEGGNTDTLHDFCVSKAQADPELSAGTSESKAQEAETWSFLSILYEAEEARRSILNKLGFKDIPERLTQQPNGDAEMDPAGSTNGHADAGTVGHGVHGVGGLMRQLSMKDGVRPAVEVPTQRPSMGGIEGFGADDPDFFDNLDDLPPSTPSSPRQAGVFGATGPDAAGSVTSPTPHSAEAAAANGQLSRTTSAAPPCSNELEAEINTALIVGNYAAAVEHCFKAARYADALLIANTAGKTLYQQVMRRYLRKAPHPYQAIISANIEGDYAGLVKGRLVGQWRETLALLCTYTERDHFRVLVDQLATRLSQAGMFHEASLCWICGGHTDQAVAYWSKKTQGAATNIETMQNVIEKAVVMGLAPGCGAGGVNKASHSLSELVTSYSSLLAAQGRMAIALDYLEHVPGEASTAVAVLKDRIFRSAAVDLPTNMFPPPFPFIQEEVVQGEVAVAQSSLLQQQQQSQQAPAAAANPYAQQGYSTNAYAAVPAAAVPANSYYTQAQPNNNNNNNTGYPAQSAPYSQQQPTQQQQQQPARAMYSQQQPTAQYNITAHNNQHTAGAAAAQQYTPSQQQQQQYAQPAAASSYAPQASAYNPSYPPQSTSNAGMYQPQTPSAMQQQSAQDQSYTQQQQQPYAGSAYNEPAPAVYNPKRAVPAAAPMSTAHHPAVFAPTTSANPPTAPQQQQPQQIARQPSYPPSSSAPSGSAAPQSTAGGYAPGPYQPQQQPQANHQQQHLQPVQVVQQPSFFTPTANTPIQLQPSFSATAGGMPMQSLPSGGGINSMVPPAPASQRPPPVQATGPPANISISTADTSAVPQTYQPIVSSLTNLFNSCVPLANNPAKKREMDDNSKKLGQLFWKLNAGELSAELLPQLQQLCLAIDAANWTAASGIQGGLTTSHWDECGFWLTPMKRLIKSRSA
ncbi:MAG: hypothetical protein WDW36_008602 [Sanguina aurantia]